MKSKKNVAGKFVSRCNPVSGRNELERGKIPEHEKPIFGLTPGGQEEVL